MSSKENYKGVVSCKKCNSQDTIVICKKDFEEMIRRTKQTQTPGSSSIDNLATSTGVSTSTIAGTSVSASVAGTAGAVLGAAVGPVPIVDILSIGIAAASLITSYLQLQTAKANDVELIVFCNTCRYWEKI
jgi:hypothetical protein